MTKLITYIINNNNFKYMKSYCLKSSVGIYLKIGFNLIKKEKHKYFYTYIVEMKK